MIYLIILIVLVILLYARYRRGEKEREKERRESRRASFGKAPERMYAPGEMERISRLYRLREEAPGPGVPGKCTQIDDITWNDLDMDAVYALVNHTFSAVGDEYLYRMLRTPETDAAVVAERSRLADVFSEDESLREGIGEAFGFIGRGGSRALCDLITEMEAQPQRSNALHWAGLAAYVVSILLIAASPLPGILLLVAVLAFQLITYFREKAKVSDSFTCVTRIVGMSVCAQVITEKFSDPRFSEILESLESCARDMEPVRRRSRFIALGHTMGGSPFDLILDYVRMLFHTDLIAYNQLLRLVQEREQSVWGLYEALGQLECALSTASFRASLPVWCRPVFRTDQTLCLYAADLVHPLLKDAVPNSVHAQRGLLITGSNASGKSTFLKTVAVNAVLAQTLGTAAGTAYEAPFWQIASSMALTDSLSEGESYYMAEIRSLKRILDRGDDELPVLAFVDEVLRGTNTVERIAASAQILKRMAGADILCFAATHDGELAELLAPWYENVHFPEEMTDGDIRFTYRLTAGAATGRNAIRLLDRLGYDETLVKEAEEMAARFLAEKEWRM